MRCSRPCRPTWSAGQMQFLVLLSAGKADLWWKGCAGLASCLLRGRSKCGRCCASAPAGLLPPDTWHTVLCAQISAEALPAVAVTGSNW